MERPSPLASRLRRKEGVEYLLPDLRWDASAVVAYPNFHLVPKVP